MKLVVFEMAKINIFFSFLLAISLCACVTAGSVENLETVELYFDNGAVSPEYRFSESLVIGGDLTTHWTRSDIQGKQQRTGSITLAQMQALKEKIEQSNYMHVSVEKFDMPLVGASNRALHIDTNLGSRGFSDDCYSYFPDLIAAVYAELEALKPE